MDAAAKPDSPKTEEPAAAAHASTPAAAHPARTPAPAPPAAAKPASPAIKPVAPTPAPTKTATKSAATPRKTASPKRPAPAAKEKKMATTMENTADKAQAMMKDAANRAKNAADKGQQVAGDMTEFGKGNIEAMVESSKIAAKGMETMAQDAMAFAKQSFEEATSAAKTFASAKSPTEFMKLQSEYVRTSFDAMVAHNSRSTEAMMKLVGEVVQPMSNRVSIAKDKVKAAS